MGKHAENRERNSEESIDRQGQTEKVDNGNHLDVINVLCSIVFYCNQFVRIIETNSCRCLINANILFLQNRPITVTML